MHFPLQMHKQQQQIHHVIDSLSAAAQQEIFVLSSSGGVDIFGDLSEYLTFMIKIFIIKLRIALAPQSRNYILEFIFL